ncbi:MAG: hypothetical protein GZ091_14015 [Paludibacter sp.]|nr:hypothetical protein [Paludibacter sp.]
MNKFKLIILSFFVIVSLMAQDLSKLTPDQMEMYKKYMAGKGTSTSTPVAPQSTVELRTVEKNEQPNIPATEIKVYNRIFGSTLFDRSNLTFEPKLNIPTPQNYVLGTYDELIIDISGLYDANFKLKVSPEGVVRIPNIGFVKVAGRTIEDASRIIKSQLSKTYSGISSGETKVNVTLGSIRSIRVTVVGEAVRPGTYTLPSLATAFNALYSCGGPNDVGSMRDIKVIRAGKIIANLDVYSFLVDGLRPNNIPLQDEDIVRIDLFKVRLTIDGAVKRNGIFEVLPGESLLKIIGYAGGYADNADRSKARVFRLTEKGITVVDVSANQIAGFIPQSGDSCNISTMYEYSEGQTVSIVGSVKFPGQFPLIENISLKDLLVRAGGFTVTALTDSVELIRSIKDQESLFSNTTKSVVKKFQLDKDMNFKAGSEDILLESGDQVIVRRISGFEGVRMARVEGEVLYPGSYNIKNKSIRVSDIIKQAGGMTNYAYPPGAFLIRVENANEIEKKLNKIMKENSKNQLEGQQTKTLDATMLKASGSTTVQGYTAMDSLQKKLSGSSVVDKLSSPEAVVGLNLNEIINVPGGKFDLILDEGDIIYIPRELQTVRVIGQVLFPTLVRYDATMSFKDYISSSGGYSVNAERGKSFVLYANGTAKSTKSFLGIKCYPTLEPGARIIVPDKPVEIKNKLSTAETVAILTSITSSIALIYSIITR